MKILIPILIVIAILVPTIIILELDTENFDMIELQPCNYEDCYNVQIELYHQEGEEYLMIAFCESGFNPLAKSSISSASGIFQFLKGTWLSGIERRNLDWTEEDVFDYKKNINMALWFIEQGEISRWNESKHCWQPYAP